MAAEKSLGMRDFCHTIYFLVTFRLAFCHGLSKSSYQTRMISGTAFDILLRTHMPSTLPTALVSHLSS